MLVRTMASTEGAHNSHAVDLIVAGGDVVTMNPAREVLVGGSIAIAGGRIAAVGSTRKLRSTWPNAEVLDATDCVVTPGLVNAHQHLTGDPQARSSIPDLLEPGRSIFEWSVPLHGAHTPDDDELAATICAAESLRYGVTTVVEAGTVAYPDRVAAAMRRVGLRGTVGTWGWDIEEGPYAAPTDEVLDRQRAVLAAYPRGDDLVEGWVTLVGHNLASDAHDAEERSPALAPQIDDVVRTLPELEGWIGWLTDEVPRAIVAGEPVERVAPRIERGGGLLGRLRRR